MTNLPVDSMAYGVPEAVFGQQTICARQEGMASMPVQRLDEAKAGIVGSKWRESGERDTEAIVQRGAGEEATEMERAEEEPCMACSSVA